MIPFPYFTVKSDADLLAKTKHTESLPCIQCIPWLTTSIADHAGGLAGLYYSEESGANITSYLAAR